MEHLPLATLVATRVRDARLELTGKWLERLAARVDVPANAVFPSDELLDHMPALISGIADHIEDSTAPVDAQSFVVSRAVELGALRHQQGFSASEILKEFEILGGILFAFIADVASTLTADTPHSELAACAHRLFTALSVIQQTTTAHYLQLMRADLNEREERLRAFNRALTHEFRNRIGAAMGAGQILELPTLDDAERSQLTGVIVRNLDSMKIVLGNLVELTKVNLDSRQQRHVRLPEAVAEALVHLRDMARAQKVDLEVTDAVPDVEVNAAVTELCLTNLISNAIKYASPDESNRWIRVSGRVVADPAGAPAEAIVEIRDNGIGVPKDQRDRLFQRLFRGDNAELSGADGTGLGLSIVREMVESMGGRVWMEPTNSGSVFAVALPCRRATDRSVLALESHLPTRG